MVRPVPASRSSILAPTPATWRHPSNGTLNARCIRSRAKTLIRTRSRHFSSISSWFGHWCSTHSSISRTATGWGAEYRGRLKAIVSSSSRTPGMEKMPFTIGRASRSSFIISDPARTPSTRAFRPTSSTTNSRMPRWTECGLTLTRASWCRRPHFTSSWATSLRFYSFCETTSFATRSPSKLTGK